MAYCNTYSGLGAGFTNAMQAVANTARQIAQTATNAKNNQNPNTAAQIATQPITGGQVVAAQRAAASVAQQAATLPPVTTSPQDTKPAKTWKDYLLWIALGGVVTFGAYKMLSGGKKKRR